MSAIRRNDRRVVRNHTSSPYKRPKAGVPKKSGWSLSSIFTFLNPFQGKSATSDDEEEGDSRDETDEEPVMATSPSTAAETLSRRGHDLAQLHPEPTLPLTDPSSYQSLGTQEQPVVLNSPPATPGPSGPSRFEPQQSPSQRKYLDVVEHFLQERDKSRPLHHVEYTGLVELLKESTKDAPQDHPEPFRFSPSVSPARGESPLFNVGPAGPSATPQTPRKTLSKNPNGPYRWQSSGSARPRNRYQSPAFGPPRPSPSKMKISPPETPRTDSKRRRVGADAQSATPQRAEAPSLAAAPRAAPVPSTTPFPISNSTPRNVFLASATTSTANGQAPNGQQHGPPATPRLRTSVPPKPTAPAMPSPLRQSWKQSDSPPQAQPSPPRQPTRAANFMSGLLKDVAPPKKPDVLNPYQTMSPVPPVPSAKKPLRKRKAAEQPKAKPKEEKKTETTTEAGLSPQRIIEATVPKGSKRSRPPADLQKRTPSPTKPTDDMRGEKAMKSRVNGINGFGLSSAEELSDEEEQPSPPKKQKKTQRESKAPSVEEVEDVEMFTETTYTRPAEVVEPSEGTSSNSSNVTTIFGSKTTSTSNVFLSSLSPVKPAFGPKSSIPKEPSKLRFGFAAEPEPEEPAPVDSSAIEPPPAPTLKHATLPKPALPPSTVPSPTSGPLFGEKFSHASPAASIEPVASTSTLEDAKAVAKSVGPAALPTFAFTIRSSPALNNFKEREAAKAATFTSLPTFTISFDAKSTATPSASAPKSTAGFDWAASGMKPPSHGTDGWTCSVCMVKSPDSAAKCIACEEPKPGAKLKLSTASAGFNWEAAGMKPQPKAAGGTWTCSVCMLQNATGAQKCTICDAPQP